MRRATACIPACVVGASISIHALLAESDHAPNHNPCLHSNFYPRSPCGERLSALWMALSRLLFLSTLSLRRATLRPTGNQPITPNFYPRSPCGERLEKIRKLKSFVYFYPRSPCGERHPKTSNHPHSTNFYPRSPCGERPSYSQHVTRPSGYFYPRSPCGERRREGPHCQGLS